MMSCHRVKEPPKAGAFTLCSGFWCFPAMLLIMPVNLKKLLLFILKFHQVNDRQRVYFVA